MLKSKQNFTSSNKVHKKGAKFCFTIVPARFIFIGLSFLALLLAYAYKVVLSMAIVSMVGKSHRGNTVLNDTCLTNETINILNDDVLGEFHWDKKLQAIILGGFFYGYVITQLPAGVLSKKFGAKWILGVSMLCAAILSLLGPIAAKQSPQLFLMTRIGQGLAAGFSIPCLYCMICRWMPKMERSRGTTIIFTGTSFGTIITYPLTAYLVESRFLGGWPSVFYVLGVAGCVWFVFWAILVFEDPDTHPYISQEEYNYIIENQGQEKCYRENVIPWKSILTSIPVYALIITHFGQNWGFLTILTLLPTYFESVLNMDLKHNSLWSSLPYLLQAMVGWIVSFISDKLRQEQVVSINVIRKVNNTIAFLSPAICLVGVTLVKCNISLSIFFFVLGMGLNGSHFSGYNSTHVDMSPEFAAILMGITNTIANIPGFLAPLVAQIFYQKGDTLTNWSYVFYISALVYVLTALIYLLFGSAQLQSWSISRNEETLLLNDNNNKKNSQHSIKST